MWGIKEFAYGVWVGKPESKGTLEGTKCRWEGDTVRNLRKSLGGV
jgi:hypothetical protein